MINKVILVGRLGQDPEVRTLESGAKLAKFSVATNENFRDRSGEWQERTEWHNVIAWRYNADKAERSLNKGSLVYVEGKLTHRKYTDNENIERYITEVNAAVLKPLEFKSDGSGTYQGGQTSSPSTQSSETQAQSDPFASDLSEDDKGESSDGEDDLPF